MVLFIDTRAAVMVVGIVDWFSRAVEPVLIPAIVAATDGQRVHLCHRVLSSLATVVPCRISPCIQRSLAPSTPWSGP